MVSSRVVQVFLYAICILIAPAIAVPGFFLNHTSCSDKEGHYKVYISDDSTYKANIIHLLSSLNSGSTGIDNGFYNLSYGENPDKVYAIALCRGDVKPDDCRNCINLSKDVLPTQFCPNQNEAIVWYKDCMLRYSNRTIFSTMEDTPEHSWENKEDSSDEGKVEFRQQLLGLLENLTDEAAAGGPLRKFAVGHAPVPAQRFQTIYALVQCTPDLSHQDCKYCLSGTLQNHWKDNSWTIGMRVIRPSCNLRYEIHAFYDLTAETPPPPPPPPDKGSDKFRTMINFIVVAAVVALMLLAINSSCTYLRVRKSRKKSGIRSNSTTRRNSSSMIAPILPLTSKFGWDVFLSFRGPDTRKNFTDHLYSALVRVGIHTFLDDKELPKGEIISTELLNAIQGSRISIVVFSKGYASSKWCLDELVKIVDCRQTLGHTLLPIFYHMDPSDVRRQTGMFAEAFVKHEEQFQTNLERVQKWRDALTEAGNYSGFHLDSIENAYESKFIKKIVKEVLWMKAHR